MPFQVNLIQVLQQFLPQLKLSQEEGFSKFYLPLAFFPTVNYCTVSVFDHPVQLLIVYLSVSQFEHVATYLVHLSLFLFFAVAVCLSECLSSFCSVVRRQPVVVHLVPLCLQLVFSTQKFFCFYFQLVVSFYSVLVFCFRPCLFCFYSVVLRN